MPSFFHKLASRWNNNSNTPNYGPIGPIPPRDTKTPWRQRLAKMLGAGQPLPLRTASYRPLHQAWFHQPRDLPPFTFETINSMFLDPGIRLNLAMRAAPIYGVQFAYPSGTDASGKTIYQPGIQARNPAVAAWVARQLSTIWHNDLPAILRSQVYGWAGGEVALRFTDNSFIEIDRLVPRHPGDVRLLQCEGRRYGVKVLRVQDEGDVSLQFPAAWFHSFRPDDGEDYGTSILLGAYSPWADKWFNGGALDTRRLFMHKDAYGGMKIAYPEEDIYVGNEAVPTSARDIAAQMVEQRKAGGTITYPSTLDMQGNPKWRIEEATTANNPQHILQYPKDCDDEIRIGMEIPDDVISNDGSGAWAGKRIPLAAFYASLDTWVVQILADLRHTLEPLIMLNWGRAEDFEICHKPLALQAMEQQGQAASQAPDLSAQAPATTARRSSNTAQPPDLRAQPPITTAQAVMLSGSSPHRMSLNTRRSLSHKEQADRYQRAHLMAALLTRIYGPEAERYFDEAFGTTLSDTNSTYSSSTRHPHEFQRMSAQISRSVGFNRIPWDPLKHPRGRDGRFIEKYGIDAFTATQSQINATLDPNANPSRGRVSDDVRPLLEHLNILDDSQLHNLLTQYEQTSGQSATKTVAPDSLIHKVNYQLNGEEQDAAEVDNGDLGNQPKASDRNPFYTDPSDQEPSPEKKVPPKNPPNRKDDRNNVRKAFAFVNEILQKKPGPERLKELKALLSWMTLEELKEFATRYGIFHHFNWLPKDEYQFGILVDYVARALEGAPAGFQLSNSYPLTEEMPPHPATPPDRADNLKSVDRAKDAINVVLSKHGGGSPRLNRLIWLLSKLTYAELQELAKRYLTFSEYDESNSPTNHTPYLNLLLKIAYKLGRNVPDDFRLSGSTPADKDIPSSPPQAPTPPSKEPPPTSPELQPNPQEPKQPEQPEAPKPIDPPKMTPPADTALEDNPQPEGTEPEEEPDEGVWAYDNPDEEGKQQEPLPPRDDQQFGSNVLRILGYTSKDLRNALSRGGVLLGIQRAAGEDYNSTRRYSTMTPVAVKLPDGKTATVYLDPRGPLGAQSSSAMIYYDPSLNESEVAQALESPEFVKAWNAHQNKSSGVPYNVEGGFDVLDKFKADQKEGFRQAAPIIHDLVMDVVRSTGGEIPYAMYVISEHGVVEYLGGQLQEKIDDVAATAQFAREHPLQAGGMAVVAVAVGGKIIGAKRSNSKKASSKAGRAKPNVEISASHATSSKSSKSIDSNLTASTDIDVTKPTGGPSNDISSTISRSDVRRDVIISNKGVIDGLPNIEKLRDGRLGGKILDKEWRDALKEKLQALDPDLKLQPSSRETDSKLDEIQVMAGFQPEAKSIYLRTDGTLFEAIHELGHAKLFVEEGSDATRYLSIPKPAREMEAWRFVLDYNKQFPGRLSAQEVRMAEDMLHAEFQALFGNE